MTPAERTRKWREDNPEKSRANIARHQTIRKLKGPEGRRNENLKYRYNIDLSIEAEMISDQGGVCKICGATAPSQGVKMNKHWLVDHDHSCCPGTRSCGKCVRGLLCSKCNVALGGFNDDPDLLEKAAQYIRLHRVG